MTGKKEKTTKDKRSARYWLGLVLFFTAFPAIIAFAAVVINPPVSDAVSSKFGMRSIKEYNYKLKPHKGLDYATPKGTKLDLNYLPVVSMECTKQGDGSTGYGYYAKVVRECDVMEKFAHLTAGGCNSTAHTVLSGDTGIGNPHLHHEIMLGGANVDPALAYGKDLCDPEIRKMLIDDANKKLNGLAGKDGKVPPVSGDNDGTTYVPPGENPGGTIPDGVGGVITLPTGGYYVYEGEDGRITVVAEDQPPGEIPALTPGQNPDLTPNGETDNEVTGCATDTWTAMVNQSVLQTRREMVINQTYIAKPDSVMAYSCITDAIDHVREELGPIFSETKRWVNVDVDILGKTVNLNKELGEYSLDGAIVNAALTPYETWMQSNFAYGPLGGTTESGGEEEEEGGEHGHNEGEDQSYTGCGYQAMVWQLAKCKNPEEGPMFYKFEDLITNDPRKYPHQYACNYTGITQAQIDTARGNETRFDNVNLYYDLLEPEDGACTPAIQTGITVVLVERAEGSKVATERYYPDGVCLSPGCSYQNESGTGRGLCIVK